MGPPMQEAPDPVSLPSAVVFDCDGTLVDSERVATTAMREALASMGHELTTDDVASLVGRTWVDVRSYMVRRWGLSTSDLEEYQRRQAGIARPRLADPGLVFDDVVTVVDQLAAAGVPLGVCTSSRQGHLDRILRLEPLRDRFVATVAAEDTDRHKPDPTPYLLAIERIGDAVGARLDRADVVVVEDSNVGVAAGVAAGCWTVAVDRGAAIHDLGAAHVVVEDLGLSSLRPDW